MRNRSRHVLTVKNADSIELLREANGKSRPRWGTLAL